MAKIPIEQLKKVSEARIRNGAHIHYKLRPSYKHISKLELPRSFRLNPHQPNKTLLGDKALLIALNYVADTFYEVDDFWKVPKRKQYKEEMINDSFERMADLTKADITKGEYRRAFCRLICWAQNPSEHLRIPSDSIFILEQSVYDTIANYMNDKGYTKHRDYNLYNELWCYYSVQSSSLKGKKVYDFKIKDGRSYKIDKYGFLIWEPFSFGSKMANRKLHETFSRILMRMGSLEDAVQAAAEHPSFLTSTDLVDKIEESITSRKIDAGEALLKTLVAYEPGNSEISRLERELGRLTKIGKLQKQKNIDFALVDKMSGLDFEQLVSSKFEELGFRAESTAKTGDYGADIIVVSPNETTIAVQCKRFKTKVNLKAVQEVVGSLSHYQCDYGIVITNSTFLNSAKKLAANNDIELWDKDSLVDFFSGDISFSDLREL